MIVVFCYLNQQPLLQQQKRALEYFINLLDQYTLGNI